MKNMPRGSHSVLMAGIAFWIGAMSTVCAGASDADLRSIVDRAITAAGGREALDRIDTAYTVWDYRTSGDDPVMFHAARWSREIASCSKSHPKRNSTRKNTLR